MESQQPPAQPRWLDDGEQAVWRSFLAMQGRLAARLNRDLQDGSGVSSPDFAVLVTLSEHADGRMRVLELARGLEWEKSRLSHQLNRMQQRGLVERVSCDLDRRGAWIGLTAHGRAMVEAAAPRHVETVRRYLFDRLGDGQLEALGGICAAVLDALGDCAAECPGIAEAADGCPEGAGVPGIAG